MPEPDISQQQQSAFALRFASEETEQTYRRSFLGQDKRQAVIAIALYTILKLSFAAIRG